MVVSLVASSSAPPVAATSSVQMGWAPVGDRTFSGTCKFYDVEKGYGFIKLDSHALGAVCAEIFVHHTDMPCLSLDKGERLEFRIAHNEKRGQFKATDLSGHAGWRGSSVDFGGAAGDLGELGEDLDELFDSLFPETNVHDREWELF